MPDDGPEPDFGEPAGDLDIRAAGQHRYEVTITHPSGARTRHIVSVPESLMADLRVSAAQEPILVRASLTYLLEHRPSALPDEFELDEVAKAIPEYREDIVDRL